MTRKQNFQATDPSGKAHSVSTTRTVAFAVFKKLPDGTYTARFAKTLAAARQVFGAEGIPAKATLTA